MCAFFKKFIKLFKKNLQNEVQNYKMICVEKNKNENFEDILNIVFLY